MNSADRQPESRSPSPDRRPMLEPRTKLLAWCGFGLTMSVIVGLWLVLLPGQLNSSRRQSEPSSLWSELRSEKDTAAANWQEAKGSVSESWNGLKTKAAEPPPLSADQQAEIRGFRDRLESAAAGQEPKNEQENLNQPRP